MERRIATGDIPFTKMVGAGNDFVLIDNRTNLLKGSISSFVKKICSRRLSIGADGVLLLEESGISDFKMRYFNSDGGEAEFCGNGARCIALYAFAHGIAGKDMSFESQTGVRRAQVNGMEVTIDMPEPKGIRLHLPLTAGIPSTHSITVGVPHVVIFTERVDDVNVVKQGRAVREMDRFQPEGANVNYVQRVNSTRLKVRTYERGVEDETYSCGTGVCASAVIAHLVHGVQPPVTVSTRIGEILTVSFRPDEGRMTDCTLTGGARIVYRGTFMYD